MFLFQLSYTKLSQIKKNYFSKLSWPGLEPSSPQSLPCPSTTTPYFLLNRGKFY